jgi:hypothetical protein
MQRRWELLRLRASVNSGIAITCNNQSLRTGGLSLAKVGLPRLMRNPNFEKKVAAQVARAIYGTSKRSAVFCFPVSGEATSQAQQPAQDRSLATIRCRKSYAFRVAFIVTLV